MNTVILAAGRGSRLRGVAAPYHKCFMVVQGKALIVQAVECALANITDGERVIVVAAPDNVVPIIALLRDSFNDHPALRYVVQPDPTGPGAAFLLGTELLADDAYRRILVLMADNVLTYGSVLDVVAEANNRSSSAGPTLSFNVVHTPEEAARFTRITPENEIVERPEVLPRIEEWEDGYHVWVGPLVLPLFRAREALLKYGDPRSELQLGRWLGKMGIVTAVRTNSIDIGTVDELAART